MVSITVDVFHHRAATHTDTDPKPEEVAESTSNDSKDPIWKVADKVDLMPEFNAKVTSAVAMCNLVERLQDQVPL